MVLINDDLVYLEDHVGEDGVHTHIIHRTLKECIEDLEKVEVALHDAISCLQSGVEE